jgi:hypothetical protein
MLAPAKYIAWLYSASGNRYKKFIGPSASINTSNLKLHAMEISMKSKVEHIRKRKVMNAK